MIGRQLTRKLLMVSIPFGPYQKSEGNGLYFFQTLSKTERGSFSSLSSVVVLLYCCVVVVLCPSKYDHLPSAVQKPVPSRRRRAMRKLGNL